MGCEKCGGRGWILYKKDGIDFAKPCECQEVMKARSRLNASGISDEFHKKGFKNFSDRGKEVLRNARLKAIEYCKNYTEIKNTNRNSIIFMGQVGSGKTHLSMAICNNLMDCHKVGVIYMPYRDEITKIKQTIKDEINYQNALNRFKTCQALMIDDLLKGKNTEADANILFEIINYRYLNMLPIIVSTEKTRDELLDFDEGVMSRVLEMTKDYQIEIIGEEYNYRLL